MTNFVHDYTMCFTVHTTEANPYEVEGQVLRDALIASHSTLTDEEIIEALTHLQTVSERDI